jgi:pimeloyl-ACP methyl ester carboxylesterase
MAEKFWRTGYRQPLYGKKNINSEMNNINYRKYSITIFSYAAIIYIAYCVFFFILQRNLLFPVEHAMVPDGISERIPDSSKLWIENDFGKTETWYLPPIKINSEKKHPLIIVGHGNGDVIDRWLSVVSKLREIGIGVLLVEYPGYGRSDGRPNEKDITNVFIKSYDLIISKPEINKNKIILLGQSIGGGAICALANNRPSNALILISTFTDVGVLAAQYYLPKFLVKDRFDNLAVVSKYEKPILIVHGRNDNLIPFSESEKLNSVALNSKLITLNGGHNMIKKWRPFWENIVIPYLDNNKIL